jgi:hypothetical protein
MLLSHRSAKDLKDHENPITPNQKNAPMQSARSEYKFGAK